MTNITRKVGRKVFPYMVGAMISTGFSGSVVYQVKTLCDLNQAMTLRGQYSSTVETKPEEDHSPIKKKLNDAESNLANNMLKGMTLALVAGAGVKLSRRKRH